MPSSYHPGQRRQSAIGLAMIAVIAATGLVTFLLLNAFLTPTASAVPPRTIVDAGLLEDLPLRQPVYIQKGNLFVVRMEDKTVIALSAVNTHPTACTIAWMPDFRMRVEHDGQIYNDPGWFRDPCVGATFDLAGNRVYGPAPVGMTRYEVQIVPADRQRSNRVQVLTSPQHETPARPVRYPTEIIRP